MLFLILGWNKILNWINVIFIFLLLISISFTFNLAKQEAENPCFFCHADVIFESKDGIHEENKIDCITCHGKSIEHTFAEDNSVKPEKIFKKADIVEFCGSCHNNESKDYQLSKHSEVVNKGIKNSPTCSTCHGKHRLKSKKELEEGCLVCHENKSEDNIFKTTSRINEDNLKLYQPHSLKE